ncbi:MAG: DsrE family protein [Candidatus Competibacterales bacterium]|nr:DsrE family protein [Candidatus Competibacterales bacterium]
MAEKLVIIMANADPTSPSAVSAPLFQATVAAAMEYDVELIITGRAGELALKGMAEKIAIPGSDDRTLQTLVQEAHEAGVRIKICTTALSEWGDELIPEVEESVGGAYIISKVMDDHTVTLTY